MTISSLVNATILGFSGHMGGPNGTVTRVVIHGTVSATVRGGARNIAGYFQSPNSGGLAHYVVDPGEIIACCDEDVWCWHAPPNPGSIGIELCDVVDGDVTRWADDDHQAMLALAARLTADVCHRRSVATGHVGAAQLLAGAWGIPGHLDVSEAWHQSDHHDPGDGFPWDQFIALVNNASPGGSDVPAPTDFIKHLGAREGIPAGYWHLKASGEIDRTPDAPWRPHAMLRNDGHVYVFPYTEAGVTYQDYADLPAADRVQPPASWISDCWVTA